MATIKFTFFVLTLFGLLQAYNARDLQDVIQMVTGEVELQSPPSSPSLDDKITYGRVNKSPPPPRGAPSRGQTNVGQDNPKDLPHVKTTYGRDSPKAPSTPHGAPPQVQTTYGRDSPKAPSQPQVKLLSPNDAPSQGEKTYARDNPNSPPQVKLSSPNDAPSQGERTYGRDNPKAPPPPKVAPSRGQTTYGEINPIQTSSSEEHQWHYIASYLPSYVIRVFNLLGQRSGDAFQVEPNDFFQFVHLVL